jgi:hypothetical protein
MLHPQNVTTQKHSDYVTLRLPSVRSLTSSPPLLRRGCLVTSYTTSNLFYLDCDMMSNFLLIKRIWVKLSQASRTSREVSFPVPAATDFRWRLYHMHCALSKEILKNFLRLFCNSDLNMLESNWCKNHFRGWFLSMMRTLFPFIEKENKPKIVLKIFLTCIPGNFCVKLPQTQQWPKMFPQIQLLRVPRNTWLKKVNIILTVHCQKCPKRQLTLHANPF